MPIENPEITIQKIKEICGDLFPDLSGKRFRIMEVCGTHTMSIAKFGLSQLLPSNISMISGPGCPVCVTSATDIDRIIEISEKYDVTIFTFGDMVRVPGSETSFAIQKSRGKKIKVCYSPLDALDYAKENPLEKVIFVAIGFETTAPLTATVIRKAYEENLKNFFVYSLHKIIPPAIDALLFDPDVGIDAMLLPGHVSVIIGLDPYRFIAGKYKIPAAIGGFEAESILRSIYLILNQVKNKIFRVEIEYSSAVKNEGNPKALEMMNEVFDNKDAYWRGIGIIKKSGLYLNNKYGLFDADIRFPVNVPVAEEPYGCECGNILKGIKRPYQCSRFRISCTPDNPIGPCMVSSEGACAAYYRYGNRLMEK
jgi:hydrogenase expression/formation protein HypD